MGEVLFKGKRKVFLIPKSGSIFLHIYFYFFGKEEIRLFERFYDFYGKLNFSKIFFDFLCYLSFFYKHRLFWKEKGIFIKSFLFICLL